MLSNSFLMCCILGWSCYEHYDRSLTAEYVVRNGSRTSAIVCAVSCWIFVYIKRAKRRTVSRRNRLGSSRSLGVRRQKTGTSCLFFGIRILFVLARRGVTQRVDPKSFANCCKAKFRISAKF